MDITLLHNYNTQLHAFCIKQNVPIVQLTIHSAKNLARVRTITIKCNKQVLHKLNLTQLNKKFPAVCNIMLAARVAAAYIITSNKLYTEDYAANLLVNAIKNSNILPTHILLHFALNNTAIEYSVLNNTNFYFTTIHALMHIFNIKDMRPY